MEFDRNWFSLLDCSNWFCWCILWCIWFDGLISRKATIVDWVRFLWSISVDCRACRFKLHIIIRRYWLHFLLLWLLCCTLKNYRHWQAWSQNQTMKVFCTFTIILQLNIFPFALLLFVSWGVKFFEPFVPNFFCLAQKINKSCILVRYKHRVIQIVLCINQTQVARVAYDNVGILVQKAYRVYWFNEFDFSDQLLFGIPDFDCSTSVSGN